MAKTLQRITTQVVVFLLLFAVVISPLGPALAEEGTPPSAAPATQEVPTETASEEIAVVPQEESVPTEEVAPVDEEGKKKEKKETSDGDVLAEEALATESLSALASSSTTSLEQPHFTRSAPKELSLAKVDETVGALTYAFGFVLPPGRNGMTPEVGLSYQSQQGDNQSPVGYGWSLSLPVIERVNRYGVDKMYDPATEVFAASPVGELRLVSGATYGARVETGAFTSYVRVNDGWVATQKDGTVFRYGTASASRLADPLQQTKIARWYLDEVVDTNGNSMRYEYTADQGAVYLSRIVYTNHSGIDGIFAVVFTYAARPDVFTSYATGFPVTTAKRLTRVETLAQGVWQRRYNLSYTTGDNGSRSLLSSVVESGQSSTGTVTTMPATTFTYSASQPGWRLATDWVMPDFTSGTWLASMVFVNDLQNRTDAGVRFGDVNGDAYPELIYGGPNMNASHWNTTTRGWEPNPAGGPGAFRDNTTYDTGLRLTDYNADGLIDAIGSLNVFQAGRTGNGTSWNWNDPAWIPPVPTLAGDMYNLAKPDVRIFDANGDGLEDYVHSGMYQSITGGTMYRDAFMHVDSGWQKQSNWQVPECFFYCNFYPYQGHNNVADINHDGLMDLHTHNAYLLNRGGGWTTSGQGSFPEWLFDPSQRGDTGVRLIDLNGDRLLDFVQWRPYLLAWGTPSDPNIWRKVQLGNGNGWQPDERFTLPVDVTDGVSRDEGVRFADVNADGMIDVIQAIPRQNQPILKQVFLNTSPVPDLLTTVTYPTGGSTSVTYKPSSQYRDANGLLNPRLSSVLQTVETMTQYDGLGTSSTTRYEYAGGKFHLTTPHDRKFAGFSRITTTQPSGARTTTFFHQADTTDTAGGEHQDHDAKIGRIYRVETKDDSGQLKRVVVTKWERVALDPDELRHFIYASQDITSTYESGSTHKDVATVRVVDTANGNLLEERQYGEVSSGSAGVFADIGSDRVDVVMTYASWTSGPRAGQASSLPASKTTKQQGGQTVAEEKYFYDALASGVSKGNRTKTLSLISGTTYADTRATFDARGMVTSAIDARNNTTTATYESANLYLATMTNALGHVTAYQYALGCGALLMMTDSNGGRTRQALDGLCRPTLEEKSDPTTSGPATAAPFVMTQSIEYTDAPLNTSMSVVLSLDGATSVTSITHRDGLGRVVQQRRSSDTPGTMVANDTNYDGAGRVRSVSLPYFSGGMNRTPATTTGSLYLTYDYDALDRVIAEHGSSGSTITSFNNPWEATTSDANGHWKVYQRDAFGRLIRVHESNLGSVATTTYTYDALGRLTSYTDAEGNLRGFAYDALGRRTQAQDLHRPGDTTYGVWLSTYDNAGNLISRQDPNGSVVAYVYDALNRQTAEDWQAAAGVEVTYTYDACSNGLGRLCRVTKSGYQEDRMYNAVGNLTGETKQIDGQTFVTTITYDRQGNSRLVMTPDGAQQSYEYGPTGRVARVLAAEADQPLSLVTTYAYGPHGQPISITHANGVTTTHTYDASKHYRLIRKQTVGPAQQGVALIAGGAKTTNGDDAAVSSSQLVTASAAQVSTPTITPNGGTYVTGSSVSVTLRTTTTNATIYYTTNGSTPTTASTRYKNAFTLTSSVTATKVVRAIAVRGGYANSAEATATFSFLPRVATPVMSPVGGTYTTPQNISLTTGTAGATIYYTTNGTTPTTNSLIYTGPLTLSVSATVKAIAVKTGYVQSLVASATYTINLPTAAAPVFSPAGGTYASPQNVSLSSTTTGAIIYYTIDGSTPTAASLMYASPINVGSTTTIKAIATKYGFNNSSITTATYTINLPTVATPVIAPNGGTFTSPQQVTLSTTTAGATIYYTTDGSVPTPSATLYTGPFVHATSGVIRALATKANYQNSALGSASFTFNIVISFGPVLQDITYQYDNVGNITRLVDVSDTNTRKTVVYTYDDLDRLLTASASGSRDVAWDYTESYAYSPTGNILTKTRNGVTQTYCYDGGVTTAGCAAANPSGTWANPQAATKIGSTVLTYDKNGNQTADGATTYSWDYNGRLLGVVTGGASHSYSYDATGERVSVNSAGLSTRYPNQWFNQSSTGKIVKHLFANSGMVATVEGSGASSSMYLQSVDHLSSAGVTTDASGVAVEVSSYTPYGDLASSDTTGFSEQRKYIGEERDTTGLSYLNARYYNPRTGQFLSQDPLFLGVGDTRDVKHLTGSEQQQVLADPQGLSGYTYARNNPLRYVDPKGQWFMEVLTGRQSLSSFAVEVGDAANSLYDSSSAWRTAMDHPVATGVAAGVAGGAAAYAGAAGLTYLSANHLGGLGTACVAYCGRADQIGSQEYNTAVKWVSTKFHADPSSLPSRSEVTGVMSKWVNTSMPDTASSILYHHLEHGSGRSLAALTRNGLDVWSNYLNNSTLVKSVSPSTLGNGEAGIKVKLSTGAGGIFTKAGGIVTTWFK